MDTDRVGRSLGVASVLVTFGSTLLATVLSPAFAWTDNALSELGVAGTAVGTPTTALLFNGGLIAGALLGLGFAWFLAKAATTWLGRLTGLSFGLTGVSMGGVGVFPMDVALHGPVAVAYFLLISVTLAVGGAAALTVGRRIDGLWSLGLAGGNFGVWAVYVAIDGPTVLGLALPELGGSIIFSSWVLLTSRRWPPTA
jgi:hypothetical membrane protein